MAVMIHHLTGGEWGYFVRRIGEAAAGVLPLLFVLFIPVLVGMRRIYPWADPDNPSAVVQHKRPWMNPMFFIGRYVVYFIIWILLAWLLRTLSLRHDRSADKRTENRLHSLSAGGLVLYFITMSLAAIDWIMSLEPGWYSTVFGFIICMGQAISGMSVLIIMLALLAAVPVFKGRLRPGHFNDLATLLVTAVIMWAYTSFSQLLIVWMGNTQNEIPWYVKRTQGPWRVMAAMLVFIGFLAPFVLLLQRAVKKRGRAMLWVCVGLLVMRLLDIYWMIAPAGPEPYPGIHWLNALTGIVALIGIGGVWIWYFFRILDTLPLMPVGDAVAIEEIPSDQLLLEPRTSGHDPGPAAQPGLA